MVRRAPRHHEDAGGPAEVNEAKHAIRERVWAALRENGHARRALEDGKIVYMAVPRLAEPDPLSACSS